MSISISGVGSGLPISDWIDALVGVEQSKIDTLTEKQKALNTKSSTLNTLKSTYSSINSSTLKLTDSLHGPSADIFTKVGVTTSDSSLITATATNLATPAVVKLKVEQLATKTERRTYGPDSGSGKSVDFSDTSKKLSELGYSGEGSFKINGTVINVSEDTTIDSLVYQINNSSTAKVQAHIEDGQIVLQSTEYGASAIEVEETNSNFVNWAGWHDDNYQTLGQNAKFTVNGKEKEAATNKLTNAETGITGLSLELLSVTGDETVSVTISRDADADSVLAAMETFITNFNKAITDTDKETNSEGKLYGENSLVSIRNRLRTMVTSTVNPNGVYKSLSDIGITSGAPGMDVNADTTSLVIDKDKFYEAFSANPAAVRELLIGTSSDSSGGKTDGIMQKIQTGLKPALDTKSGYFSARNESLSSELKSLAQKISKKEDALEIYRETLTKKFNYMDQQISNLNSQFSQMQQQLASIGVKVGES